MKPLFLQQCHSIRDQRETWVGDGLLCIQRRIFGVADSGIRATSEVYRRVGSDQSFACSGSPHVICELDHWIFGHRHELG